MSMTTNCQVCLMLTARLSDKDQSDVLTSLQWGEICHKFGGPQNLEKLLGTAPVEVLEGHGIEGALKEQVLSLLGRGVGLAIASEKWLRTGT